jgi:RNA polymerase sigma-70 factor (ECF subfamily)
VEASFTEAYELHVDAIYRFILRLLGNPTDAEDMTAETFLRAYQGWSELLEPASVRAWLFRIAYNGCIDLMRQRQRHQTIPLDTTVVDEMTQAFSIPVASTESPLKQLIRSESAEFLQEALLQLRPIDRTVLVLGELEGTPNREIAKIVQRSETAVKSLRQRARKALRDEVLRLLKQRNTSLKDLF